MYSQPLQLGTLTLPHRLLQGPLAGYSCAPMRAGFAQFSQPAYSVTEMLSAKDVLVKHAPHGRYLYRSPKEGLLAYQLSGNDPQTLALAAQKCQDLGADLIDLNCGCPMPKIKKKGGGSALLSQSERLKQIIIAIKSNIDIPLSVKIRLTPESPQLVQIITEAGADALIIHARGPDDDYSKPCNYLACRALKKITKIPIIINGDITDKTSLMHALNQSKADGAMIARAGCGQPWIYQSLLSGQSHLVCPRQQVDLLMEHLENLAELEGEYRTLLQARGLIRYYLRQQRGLIDYSALQSLDKLQSLQKYLIKLVSSRL